MKLIFQNNKGEERLVSELLSVDEVDEAIDNFLQNNNFSSCYIRVCEDGRGLIIDFGSHTQFLIVEGGNFEEYVSCKK